MLHSTFSSIDQGHIQGYLNEFSYRINRSIHKQTIFDNLIYKLTNTKQLFYKDIILSD